MESWVGEKFLTSWQPASRGRWKRVMKRKGLNTVYTLQRLSLSINLLLKLVPFSSCLIQLCSHYEITSHEYHQQDWETFLIQITTASKVLIIYYLSIIACIKGILDYPFKFKIFPIYIVVLLVGIYLRIKQILK